MNCGCLVGICSLASGRRCRLSAWTGESRSTTLSARVMTLSPEYLERFRNELAGKPLDRALLACFAEEAEDGAPVADLGCGLGMWQPGSPAVA